MKVLVIIVFIILGTVKALFKNSDDLTLKQLVEKTNKLIAFELPSEDLDCSNEDDKAEILCSVYEDIIKELQSGSELEAVRQKFNEEEAVILKQLRKSAMDNFSECLISDPQVTSEMIPSIKVIDHKKEEGKANKGIVNYWEKPTRESPISKLSFFGKCFKCYWLETLRGYQKHCKSNELKSFYSQLIELLEEPKKSKLSTEAAVQGSATVAIAGGVFMTGLIITLIVMAIALKLRVDQKTAAAEEMSTLVA